MNGSLCVGIDVSRDGLEVAVRPTGEIFSVANTAPGIRKLLARLAAMTVNLICLEATGGYELRSATALCDAGYRVAVVNPRRMRRFA